MDNLLLAEIAVDTDGQVTIWGVSLIALAASIAIRLPVRSPTAWNG